jgi:predicted RNA-binding protein YlxR (DUF448 family)
MERGIMDVTTRDPRNGRSLYIDTRVTCELTDCPQRTLARANKDGVAASEQVAKKHTRYPQAKVPNSTLLPFVLECGGRPAEQAAALVRYWGSRAEDASLATASLWQRLSTTLQLGNAECILSSLGPLGRGR